MLFTRDRLPSRLRHDPSRAGRKTNHSPSSTATVNGKPPCMASPLMSTGIVVRHTATFNWNTRYSHHRCADARILSPHPSIDSDLRSASATVCTPDPQSVRIRSVYHRVNWQFNVHLRPTVSHTGCIICLNKSWKILYKWKWKPQL